jgi:hypothetical protein
MSPASGLRSTPALLAAIVALTLLPLTGRAQSVRGIARIDGTASPAAQTSVILVDSAGDVIAGAMTGSDGTYFIRAPRPGVYRLQARRIGFAPDSMPMLRLAAGAVAEFDPKLRQLSAQLPAVTVAGSRRCALAPESGAAAMRLWEDAQSALSGAAVSAMHGQVRFTLDRFEREVDPATSQLIRSRTWVLRTSRTEPYMSVAPESLAAHGFRRADGSNSVYYAPDARTLLSETFAHTHCLSPITDPNDPSRVGLGFAPVRSDDRTDVSGVLWLDRASGELRDLEFRYTPGHTAADVNLTQSQIATGRVDYERLPSGAWIIRSWVIRVPVIAASTELHFSAGAVAGQPGIVRRDTVRNVVAVWEVGGDVRAVLDSAAQPETPAGAVLRGTIVDSADTKHERALIVQALPLSVGGVDTVSNRGTLRTSPDSAGSFVLANVPSGTYALRVSAPWLDTLNIRVPDTRISLDSGSEVSVRVVIPGASAGITSACGAAMADSRAVHGTVLGGVGRPVAGARVKASWLEKASVLAGGRQVAMASDERSTISDTAGRYVLCGLPANRTITIRATQGRDAAPPIRIDALDITTSPAILLRDIAFSSPASDSAAKAAAQRGRIGGTVVDAAGRGLADVEVLLLDGSHPAVHTESSGGFEMRDVRPGAHLVRFRRVGLRPITMKANVLPGDVAETDAVLDSALSTIAPLPTVAIRGSRVDTTAFPPGVADRIRHGMGTYITYADIQRQHPVRTTELFRRIPGVGLSKTGIVSNERGIISLLTPGCKFGIPIYVDGNLMFDPASDPDTTGRNSVADLVSPNEIAAIEIYRGAAELPASLPRNPCGGVFIWTRKQ